MKPIAKLGYLAAACALLIATFSIVGPRAVRAAVATLVQVSNTVTNPVPTVATDNPALQPFAQTQQGTTGNLSLGFAVPAGKTWALEEMSVTCLGSTVIPTGQQTDFRLFLTTGGTAVQYTFAPVQVGANQELVVTQPIHASADPGTFVNIGSGSGIPGDWSCFASVSGHLVNPL
jgi:hypothetical protein